MNKIFKSILAILCMLNLLNAASIQSTNQPNIPSKDSVKNGGDIGEDVEPLVSIRSLYSGRLVSPDRVRDLLDNNWNLNEIALPDSIAHKYPFGAVQFTHTKFTDLCLGLDNGKLITISCQSFDTGNYRSAFSLLPTNTSAVQIMAIETNNECLSVGNATASTSFKSIGVRDCELDEREQIRIENLFVIGAPYINAKIVK